MEEQGKYERVEHVEGQLDDRDRAKEELKEIMHTLKDTYLEGQKLQGEQAFKDIQMRINAMGKFHTKLFFLVVFIFAIGAGALFTGKDNIGAQIIFSTLTFLAGIGFGWGIGRK